MGLNKKKIYRFYFIQYKMYKIGNGNNSNHSKVNHRQIPHSRIDDEEIIFKKYDLGRKLGQVDLIVFKQKWLFKVHF